MKGLELSRRYYEEYGKSMIENIAPDAEGRIAAGLAGEGSQCFGFDDEISQDHDFAPGFCIWLEDDDDDSVPSDLQRWGNELQQAYMRLPRNFMGFGGENIIAPGRLGVKGIGAFYAQFTGCQGVPKTNIDWLFTPETYLATATNGEVFRDDTGHFTAIREELLAFYPPDVLRKKITARAAVMSQAGQYNLLRLIRRRDAAGAMLAASRFAEAALSMIYLLNRRYMPFYKWAYRGLDGLELCSDVFPQMRRLPDVISMLAENEFQKGEKTAFDVTEAVCASVAAELNRQEFSTVKSDFLQDHLQAVMDGIEDPQLRKLPFMTDCNNQ